MFTFHARCYPIENRTEYDRCVFLGWFRSPAKSHANSFNGRIEAYDPEEARGLFYP